ncbi:hypothetical protein PRIC1_004726 [Phytophthora ramorum]
MDSLSLVRPLANAIYGRVVLVRHRTSGRYYALKVMSLPHMRARRAVTGPFVQEDGEMELQILRKLGRNLVYSSGLCADENSRANQEQESRPESWSVSPVWSNAVEDDTRSNVGDEQYLLTLHQDFVDSTTNSRCMLFDYCPYGDLFFHVAAQSGGGFPLEIARSYFVQIASAVRFLHARNVAHRDLSLENVLLDSFRRCRLGDFGLANAAASSENVDKLGCYHGLQADVWSLGVILFVLVTGIPPFETASDADARFRLVSKPGGSIRELLRAWSQENRLPQELSALLDWMLRVDPRERPTADEVCAHEWLLGTTEVLQQPATTRKTPRWIAHGEKRPGAEPEEEEDGENQEPQNLSGESNQSDKAWSRSSPRSNKRVKRLG